MIICFIVIISLACVCLIQKLAIDQLKKQVLEYAQMVEDMVNGGSNGNADDYGYCWLTQDNERVWTKFQPKRVSSIYMTKKDFFEFIGRK